MAFESSPSLKDYQKGLKPKDRSAIRWRLVWMVVAALFLLTAILAVNLLKSEPFERAMGTGTVIGIVVDEQGKPLDAEIYILRPSMQGQTDARGAFEIRGVPAGSRELAIVRQGGGIELPIRVTAGGTTDLGPIPFVGTRVPGQ
ncbi:MAG: carboxypeptidase-like regulatory domain-containing protein [Anaerolineae bacterium]|nr:carboxypeptidase-like regulatory domain-containing protein [Anaerolineae bacterium]